MNFLTHQLLNAEELKTLRTNLTSTNLLWEDGKKTAGKHASLVKKNLQLSREIEISKKHIAIIGMPGCARSKKENGVDWILWRKLCDLKISSDDINHMGNGGLL